MTFADHADCMTLALLVRGRLCDQLTRRPGRRIAPGESIYLMGDPARSIFVIRRGLVKASLVTEGVREMILHMHQPGDIFGELCLCGDTRREQAVAIDESEVAEILPVEGLDVGETAPSCCRRTGSRCFRGDATPSSRRSARRRGVIRSACVRTSRPPRRAPAAADATSGRSAGPRPEARRACRARRCVRR